ncbi:endoplasmic reticulum-based factor for assembly of V-ATPase-domain-containing protein [Pseudomassariella vexata]|uniref:Endoplasmic reticulum-based factor for assembly of V-ATPase-domain-containing protein n=1 Tax=Pseudomassariella vexata TaxID=1141098 RepID=A0A1Y2E9M9_9PEZI|nr:endoplasmic reticulum-based factor for assembly of V-ATPase-domain-containing protein [Pseudomassariella vexata]ORY68273.1 endoplasmic reticulum-based factor for assembly of V-ATPase-domain-containing protein [Pseudomassariella vexata]
MVLLTMTVSIVEALLKLDETSPPGTKEEARDADVANELSLSEPAVGNPIGHGQIMDIWKEMKAKGHTEYTLEGLLRGATVYIPPPPPKTEPTEEYKTLMARLRRDEEERSYERMLRAGPDRETFVQRFPTAPMAHSFAEVNKPSRPSDLGEDSIDQGDIQQQVTLIINFLVSIFGCAAAIWILARWWSTPARLFLTLGGSLVVAIAEVTVYSAYSWRMEQGDKKEQGRKEVREITKTWVVGEDQGKDVKEGYELVLIKPKDSEADMTLRKRVAGST